MSVYFKFDFKGKKKLKLIMTKNMSVAKLHENAFIFKSRIPTRNATNELSIDLVGFAV